MFTRDVHQLLDFGGGRKLERFGSYVLNRPSPAAEGFAQEQPELWPQADARYDRGAERRGDWRCAKPIADRWPADFGEFTLELKLTEFGHLGLFAEQVENWRWIYEQVRRAGAIKVLNLFAYTGGSTLAAASAGAEVVHVDAAEGVVAWARRNAEASGLADKPIRWIHEDAAKFVARELKRGNRYHAVILDPPAFGHGPRGQNWKLDTDLAELLEMCCALCSDQRQFLLLTCHSGDLAQSGRLRSYASQHQPGLLESGKLSSANMNLASLTGRKLHSGAALRWQR